MPVSRRHFVRALSLGGAGVLGAPLIAARGHEAWARTPDAAPWLDPWAEAPRGLAATPLRLQSNENPYGPSRAALDAVREGLAEASRYPGGPTGTLTAAVAQSLGVKPENVLLGAGSGEVLRMAVYAFTSPTKALVTGAPSFEDPVRYAELLGAPVHAVPVDAALRLDLDGMAARCAGAGLAFVCNPNNPTGTVHGADAVRAFVARVRRASPDTVIALDEAYHEYVEDPGYATAIPLALADPKVVVVRTFSKVFGMAGLRVGYAVGHPDALAALRRQRLSNSINVLGAAAALASLRGQDPFVAEQRRLNRAAREFTRRQLAEAGFTVPTSEANFVFLDIGRDSRAFQEACAKRDVLVGRPFPPLTTHARISIGTMDEMRQALPVIREVLRG